MAQIALYITVLALCVLGLVALLVFSLYRAFARRGEVSAEIQREHVHIAERADSQNRAILNGGELLAYGFYGEYIPDDEFNVFSDYWERVLTQVRHTGAEFCRCEDCIEERRDIVRQQREERLARRAEVLAERDRQLAERRRQARLHQPIGQVFDAVTGATVTTYANGRKVYRDGTGWSIIEADGPSRVYYSDESDAASDASDPRDWQDDRNSSSSV